MELELKRFNSFVRLAHKLYDVSKRKRCHVQRIKDIQKEKMFIDPLLYFLIDYDLSEERKEVSRENMMVYIDPSYREEAASILLKARRLMDCLKIPSFTKYFYENIGSKYIFKMFTDNKTGVDYRYEEPAKITVSVHMAEIEMLKNYCFFHDNIALEPNKDSIYPYEFFRKPRNCNEKNNNCLKLGHQLDLIVEKMRVSKKDGLDMMIKNSLLFFLDGTVKSIVVIPARTWKSSKGEESSGGFVIFYPANNTLSDTDEGLFLALADSWFRQNTTSDLIKRVRFESRKKLEAKLEVLDFPHIIGSYGLGTVIDAIKNNRLEIAGACANYLLKRMEYMDAFIKEKIDPTKIDIKTIISGFKESYLLASRLSVTYDKWDKLINFDDLSPSIYAHIPHGIIETILENLVTNSLKKNATSIMIELYSDNANNKVGFKFSDNGPGFEKNIVKKIPDWIEGEFTQKEWEKIVKKERMKGFGFWSIGKALKMGNGDYDYDKEETELKNGNDRLIFTFKFSKFIEAKQNEQKAKIKAAFKKAKGMVN